MFIFNQSWWITANLGDWKSDHVGTVLKIAKWMAQEMIGWVAWHQSWVNIHA